MSFYYWIVRVLYIFCMKILCQIYDLQVFSPILWFCFHFFIVSFEAQKFSILIKSNDLFFLLLLMLLVSYLRIFCQIQCPEDIPLFLSKSFIVLALIFKCLIIFELTFTDDLRWRSEGQTWFFCLWLSSYPSIIPGKTVLFTYW